MSLKYLFLLLFSFALCNASSQDYGPSFFVTINAQHSGEVKNFSVNRGGYGEDVYKFVSFRYGNYRSYKAAFCLILLDYNSNREYADSTDLLIMARYKTDVLKKNPKGISSTQIKDSLMIRVDKSFYFVIDSIHPKGYLAIARELLNDSIRSFYKESAHTITKVPDVKTKLLNGREAILESLMGKDKLFFITFWDLSCKTCLIELDILNELYGRYSDKLVVVAINTGDDPEKVKNFSNIKRYPWYMSYSNRELEKELMKNAMPYGVLFNSAGKIVEFGVRSYELEEYLK